MQNVALFSMYVFMRERERVGGKEREEKSSCPSVAHTAVDVIVIKFIFIKKFPKLRSKSIFFVLLNLNVDVIKGCVKTSASVKSKLSTVLKMIIE